MYFHLDGKRNILTNIFQKERLDIEFKTDITINRNLKTDVDRPKNVAYHERDI